jgi:hypothetical protein
MVIANDGVGAFVPGIWLRGSSRGFGRPIGLAFAARDLIAST